MTDLQKFLAIVAEDNDLRNTLSKCTDINELATKAVELGAARGLYFTEDEALGYLDNKRSEHQELSDVELDMVVGGVNETKHCAFPG